MKAIKFTTDYEKVLYVNDSDFKAKYETIISGNAGYVQKIGGEYKHFAICPRCNNPVIILGIYKKIATAPHARHAKGINLPDITNFNEYKYLNCPYHKKKANYIKEYVDETEEPERHKLYKIAN